MSKLVVLDAGHGGKDPGAVSGDLREKDFTLKFTQMVGVHLLRSGLRVEYTRTSDEFIDLSPRAAFANKLGADFYVSYHLNSNLGEPGTGFESYVQIGCTGGETDRKRKIIHHHMAKVALKYGLADRRWKSKDLAVTRETTMDAALFELLFINNPTDALLLKNEAFIVEMSEASARGICEALGVPYKPATPVSSAPKLDPVAAKLAIALYGSITQTSVEEITVACNYAANAIRRAVGLEITTDLGKPTKAAADIIIRASGTMWEGARSEELRDCFHHAAEALRNVK
ncbi:hypothetical protein CIG75_18890 [Tumebacillus algifaecis]|uniref:MurNAc-LAA domain-containing protein n=1 Tax=Tumebacillus algifaecis TaxID=1214604 RepID=A0A223D5D0_9BACL|nr:N-acetylmuramoyl-L-alanine amidase [Tumebacillus algifaecis]ASS76802.1 hypothetical protein CIG75_18890 [Tumebacillus algifaecis]